MSEEPAHPLFTLDDAAWTEFQAILRRPVQRKPRLAQLFMEDEMSEPTTAAVTIAGFLSARFAEDEQTARAARDEAPTLSWEADKVYDGVYALDLGPATHPDRDSYGVGEDVRLPRELARHIARHDPARVLADLDAKRRIVELHADGGHPHRLPMAPWPDAEVISWKCAECGAWCIDAPSDGACPVDWRPPTMTLRLLALPYAGHPDFREEWRA